MSERVTMPALGESVTEGTVTRWLKSVGDTVEVDEPLLEVSTDKVDTEIPSPVAGTLQEILVQEDETVAVGADLAVIGEGSDADGAGGGSGAAESQDEEPEAAESRDEEPEAAEPEAAEPEAAEPEAAEPEATEPEPPATGPEAGGANGGAADEATDDTSGEASSGGSGDGGGAGGGQKITMPALGESVTEGTVTRWLKAEGDTVEVDEPLLEVSTDKVDTEIPSPVAGVLSKILVAEDETVPVGGDLAVIGGESGGGGESTSATDAGSTSTTDDDSTDGGSTGSTDGAEDASARQEQASDKADTELAEEQQVQQEGAAESQATAGTSQSSEPATADEVPPPQEAVGVGTQATQAKESSSDVSAYVTPLVRKLAAQHGVDLATLEGTGVGGRIRKQDVLDAARKAEQEAKEQPKAAPAEDAAAPAASEKAPAGAPATSGISPKRGSTEKMSRLRKVIATRMVESLQVSAQLTTVVEVDVTKVARLRAKTKDEFEEREGVKLSFMPFFALAATEALKQHPNVNASVEGDEIIYHAQENLGVAVDTEKGLIVPVIKDAGDLNIAGLARKIADLAQRTRTNKVSPDELGGGTFTLTNTGSRGALFDTPIINQPQVAILGTGAVVKRPVVVTDELGGETIAIRSMVYLALTYDHRIVDGADAARFLETIKHRLQDGAFEV